jgi:ribosomal protein S18 acetylase RimI-like enzyme
MDSDIRIVSISETHIPGFREVFDIVAKEGKFIALIEAPPLEAVRRFVRANIEGGNIGLVAIRYNKVIGWCDIIVPGVLGFGHSGRLGTGVLKGFRGRGIGSRLVERAIQKAREKGLLRIELEVYSSNLRAINLYRKFNFKLEGRKSKARYLDGVFEDIDIMALLL